MYNNSFCFFFFFAKQCILTSVPVLHARLVVLMLDQTVLWKDLRGFYIPLNQNPLLHLDSIFWACWYFYVYFLSWQCLTLYLLNCFFSTICPYLALETCRQWRLSNKTVNLMRNGKMPTVTIEQAQKNFCKVSTSILEGIF